MDDSEVGLKMPLAKPQWMKAEDVMRTTKAGQEGKTCLVKSGESNACLYFHDERNIRIEVRSDDFTGVGPKSELEWFAAGLKKVWIGFVWNCGSTVSGRCQ